MFSLREGGGLASQQHQLSLTCSVLCVWGKESAPKTQYLDFLICLLGQEPNGIDRHLPCARHCARSVTDLVQSSLWTCEVLVLLCSFSDEEIEVYRGEMICPKI